MLVLVTGATGKVGTAFVARLLADPRYAGAEVRALCHNRPIAEGPRVEVVKGDISDRQTAVAALRDASHVVHLATCKEVPETVMDVTVKGLFWLLEEFRTSPSAAQFILLGGDAGVGHFFYRQDGPVTEKTPHQAYPGCYALSKVLEEVMLTQFTLQYGLNACCLRAPWIMEKDDFRYTLSFGDDLFGGPDWKTMVPAEVAEECRAKGTIPLLRDADGRPLKRGFVHLDDLCSALLAALDNPVTRGKTYNIGMDEPVDYGALAAYLAESRGLPSIDIASPYHSTWFDNSRAKAELDWRPAYDMRRMAAAAWDYRRGADDPRRIWYPG
jgi:UDP-glucose 4-epimerase